MKKRECTGDGGTDFIAVSRLAISWNDCVCENFLLLKLAVWSSWRTSQMLHGPSVPGAAVLLTILLLASLEAGEELAVKGWGTKLPYHPRLWGPQTRSLRLASTFLTRVDKAPEAWALWPLPSPQGQHPSSSACRSTRSTSQDSCLRAFALAAPSAWHTSSAAPSGLAEMLAPWEDCSWPTTGSRSSQCMLIFSECRRVGPSLFIPHCPSRAWNSPDPESVRHGCWQNEGPRQLRKSWDGRTGPLHRTSF